MLSARLRGEPIVPVVIDDDVNQMKLLLCVELINALSVGARFLCLCVDWAAHDFPCPRYHINESYHKQSSQFPSQLCLFNIVYHCLLTRSVHQSFSVSFSNIHSSASGAQLKVSWAYCTVSSSMSVTVVTMPRTCEFERMARSVQ